MGVHYKFLLDDVEGGGWIGVKMKGFVWDGRVELLYSLVCQKNNVGMNDDSSAGY